MKKTSETKRSVEKHQASLSRIGKEVSESQLCELTSRLAVKSTMKRANSPAIWLSERQRMIKRASLNHFNGISKHSFPFSIFSERCLRVQIETVSDKYYLQDNETHTTIQNLQVTFAIASNRTGKRVCECPTRADLERNPNEADVQSPDRSRPYLSEI